MLRPLALLATLIIVAPLLRAQDARTLWTNEIQALLDQNCVKCHGPLKQKAGLELDTLEAVQKGSEDGAVVAPGKPADSKLLAALAPNADPHMPPKKQLTEHEVAEVTAWIAAMSSAPNAQTPAPVPPPATTDPAEAIDYYLAAGWKSRGIEPAPLCDDATFVRRIYLDLAGRIPKPEEAATFLADTAPRKREALIDRLLAGAEYPVAFREVWDALLLGRHSGRHEGRRRHDGWFAFLENAFKQNRPWNEVVHAIIEARPESPRGQGRVVFCF